MRIPLAFLVLAACGGGTAAFVPVSFEMTDSGPFRLFAVASKKLNPSCASNCEMGVAIEDGGCAELRLVNNTTNTWACDGAGGLFYPFNGMVASTPELVSPVRNIAPGSEIVVFTTPEETSCRSTFSISTPTVIVANRTSAGVCTFSQRSP